MEDVIEEVFVDLDLVDEDFRAVPVREVEVFLANAPAAAGVAFFAVAFAIALVAPYIASSPRAGRTKLQGAAERTHLELTPIGTVSQQKVNRRSEILAGATFSATFVTGRFRGDGILGELLSVGTEHSRKPVR